MFSGLIQWQEASIPTQEEIHGPNLVLTADPRPKLRWTADLHERFVDAVAQLGEAERKKEKDVSAGILEGNVSQCISSDTDLTAVLNAWYLAGFHTGRYLSEQSKKKNAHR